MYGFFKSVLEETKRQHKIALSGKSGSKRKLQKEYLEITYKLQESYYKDKSITKEQYNELAKEFAKISFINLAEQRNGKYKY